MSKKEKLITRFKSKPKDFEYAELRTLLVSLGYEENNKGGTSGSAVSFLNQTTGSVIMLHKPHNPDILKHYQIKAILEELQNNNLI
ncbi:type II toxin-antitoxin system HicA family toxin [Chryseobacterium sp. SG20098]|uniref:type II toxin-antitoxin system HicA family toxin n=1 Tax=Chryseobacterium sp. SG20098 TaxID=3074145 RepID=UPI0028835287|nr:type II toxin-antitoxin system HicA family toxin [Chryseobacterium sp. SG20098]WNI34681.1 type II toxin-antitoxin system HicA family toxin [Chryseobacterium sp. SG20098]